jgi:hypothetical protein
MATKKTPIADAARGFAKPARAPKAVMKVDAKRPSTKAAKERTDPVAVAGKALVKAATPKRSDPSLPGVPVVKVRTLGDLRKAILDFPVSNTFTTDQKFGTDLIHIQNIRGRTVAQIQVEKKAKPTARADKL